MHVCEPPEPIVDDYDIAHSRDETNGHTSAISDTLAAITKHKVDLERRIFMSSLAAISLLTSYAMCEPM